MIKTKKKSFVFFLIAILFCGLFLVFPAPKTASAENFNGEVVTDGIFTLTMTASARNSQVPLQRNLLIKENDLGETITYLHFNWRELQTFCFSFSANLTDPEKTYLTMRLVVSYVQDDKFTKSFGTSQPEILFQTNIRSNTLYTPNFFYNIDDASTAQIDMVYSATGHGFGIYKFDLIYTFRDNNSSQSTQISTGKLGGIYVAVEPDKPEAIADNNIQILYSVSSSSKLMNTFDLFLSNDSYKYCNPNCLQWNVVGHDKDLSNNYVLTKGIRDSHLEIYANYDYIWEALESTSGQSFWFDSKDIEGDWVAYCTIYNSDGTIKKTIRSEELSTTKVKTESYFWLWFMMAAIILFLFLFIFLIILKKRQERNL